MIKADYHMHTTYSDGSASPEEMIRKAMELGLEEVGISDHSYTSFDSSCCMRKEEIGNYHRELDALKKKYEGKIKVFKGIEQDCYSDFPAEGYDYVIGSVHCLKIGEEYITVDWLPEMLTGAAEKYFGGDMMSLCELYYETVSDVIAETRADIIGHFDLISKLNEKNRLFDEFDPRYVSAWKKAADRLLETGKAFEINTGAVSRGYRSFPYPSKEQIEYIKERGGKFILSSDAHSPDAIAFAFEKYDDLLK